MENCKICNKCGVFGQHSKNSRSKDGLNNKCKKCYSEYRKENKEKIAEKQKQYRKENKEKIAEKKKQYERKRRQQDPVFRIEKRCRHRLRQALKQVRKSKSSKELFGCTPQELRDHLNSTHTEKTKGLDESELHIDHIIPCSVFDFYREDHQRVCFHFSNLQWLTPEDNLKKSDSLPEDFLFETWFEKRKLELGIC